VKQADNGQVKLIYNGADSNYDSDPFNRISKVAQVMPDGTRYTTEYQYDIMGQMTGIRYPNSASWLTYDYDQMGRLVGIPGFAGNKDNPGFIYDDNSALESMKTDNGITTTYKRDKNGRIRNINAVKSGTSVLNLDYAFDDANNIIRRNDNTYVYDKVNRIKQATIRGVFEDTFTKADMELGTSDKDYIGNKASEQDVTELTQVKLDYSARSLILDLQTDAENICRVELTPERTGHRVPVEQIEIYYMNGFMYDKLDRNKWTGVKDVNGRITIKFTPVLSTKRLKIHCNYDDLDYLQLTVDRSEFYNSPEKMAVVYQKIYTRTETYGYDALGNRTSEKILLRKEYGYTYTYYPNSNRLKSKVKDDGSERYDYAYDRNGNLTSKVVTKGNTVDTWEYSYDLLNQLEQAKKNGVIVCSYIYDPNGFRVEKVGSKGKIHYVPLLNGEVGYRKEFSTGKEYSFIYVGGTHLAKVNGVIGGDGKKFFYHNDHEGSALVVTDENGNKVVDRDFAPFGEKIKTSDRKEPYQDETEDGFTGKDWDEDVRLYYYNARWYDPSIGRFISEDSVADDPNLYSYCFNNPVNNIDPTGHISIGLQSGWGMVGAMIGAVATLSGDSTLGWISSSFSLFVTVRDHILKIKAKEATAAAATANKPVEQTNQESTASDSTTSNSTESEPTTQSQPTTATDNSAPSVVSKTSGGNYTITIFSDGSVITTMNYTVDTGVNGITGNKVCTYYINPDGTIRNEVTTTTFENQSGQSITVSISNNFTNVIQSYELRNAAGEIVESQMNTYQYDPAAIYLASLESPGGGRLRSKVQGDSAKMFSMQGMDKTYQLDYRAAYAYLTLAAAARDAGIKIPLLRLWSGFRSDARQRELWNERYNQLRSEHPFWSKTKLEYETAKGVARPGSGPHRTGRAVDFAISTSISNCLENANLLRGTASYQWLYQNAASYGFYNYYNEPWHWEYNPVEHQ
jgi:RHS repeat-associated protein